MKVTGVGDPLHGVLVPAGPWALRAHSAVDGPGARVFWVGACLPSGESFAGLGAGNPGCGASSAFWLLFSQRCQVSQVAQECVTALGRVVDV